MPRAQLEFPFKNLPRLTHFGYSNQVETSHFGPHKHYGYELIYVASGEADVQIFEGTEPVKLKKDDLYVIAPDEVHQFIYNNGHIDYFWLGFQMGEDVVLAEHHMTSPSMLLNKDNRYSPGRVALIKLMDREITTIRDRINIKRYRLLKKAPFFNRLFQDIEYELHHKDDFSEILIYQKLLEIFTYIARLSDLKKQYTDNPLDYAYRHLKNHNKEKIDFRELAIKTGYSREHFSRAFKSRFGISPRAFHEECRIDVARDLSVQNTAFSCGFISSSHFSTWFRKRQGLSPEQYYLN